MKKRVFKREKRKDLISYDMNIFFYILLQVKFSSGFSLNLFYLHYTL
jgi:hypothetical protein